MPSFGLFGDTSEKRYLGVPISLNLAASACKDAGSGAAAPMDDDHRIFVSIPGRV